MADFTQTITNAVGIFGHAPSLWGTMIWGQDNWGDGSQTLSKDVEKNLDAEALTLADSYSKDVEHPLDAQSIATAFEMTGETLQDGNGYYEVFVRPTTDAEDRNLTEFDEESRTSSSWTEATGPNDDWSEE